MVKSKIILVAMNIWVFYLTAIVVVMAISVLLGICLAAGISTVSFGKAPLSTGMGTFAMLTIPLTTAFIALMFSIIPTAISAILFGVSTFIVKKAHLPKITLLLTSMGCSYVGIKIGLPTNDLIFMQFSSLIAGLVISSIVCYSKFTKEYFSYS
ncbi:hypothetical protein [Pseudomonas sp. TMP25]|uniref:hypothetical protein n=1 Tax=Pseudomonas sp. TMP25 TaxID=3136561 RepID=UPI003101AC31